MEMLFGAADGAPAETRRHGAEDSGLPRTMGCANKSLPDFLFYHLRNLALLPCGAKYPSMDLPEHMRREIQDRPRRGGKAPGPGRLGVVIVRGRLSGYYRTGQ
jgi:hypothetical protein